MAIASEQTTVGEFVKIKSNDSPSFFRIQRELYRGYIRETIIKPGLTPTTESDVLDHVKIHT